MSLRDVKIRQHVAGDICITMSKVEAKRYLKALDDAAEVSGDMRLRWRHLRNILRKRLEDEE